MIHEVDSALRTLIEHEAEGTRDVEIVFDAPTRDWAGRRNAPTIDVYLYDIREDLRRRERGMHNVYNESKVVVARHLPPRHFKLSYLVTAWTQRPEDEHRLLSSLLTCFLRYDSLPAEVLTGPLTDLGLPIPITIALPPPEDRAFADVWSALGGELKPSIDLVVIAPLDTGQQFHTGPPVERPPHVSLGGSLGWPTRETKSRNGVVAWPDGSHGPVAGEAGGRAGGSESRHTSENETPQAASGDETRRTSEKSAAQGRRGRGTRRTSESAGESEATSTPPADDHDWEVATGWASALPPLGSTESTEPIPGRTAGRQQPGARMAVGAVADTAVDAAADTGGDTPASESSRSGGGGATKKSASKSAKTGGRPGTRVAISRTRQPKKGS